MTIYKGGRGRTHRRYLFNSLDKSNPGNLGNAKTAGFDIDVGMKGTQYNAMLSVFFVP